MKKLIFSEEDETGYSYDEIEGWSLVAKEVSLALIAGLRDGLFPNLEELLTPGGMLLIGEVAELVEMVRGGAPCARTLKKLVMSKHFLQPVDIEPLQAVPPHATVALG